MELNSPDLPVDPPAGCTRPLLWSIARWLFADHQPGSDGLCILCRPAELHPCPARRLAAAGLRTACGIVAETTGPGWLAELRARLAAGDLDAADAPGEAMWAARQARGG